MKRTTILFLFVLSTFTLFAQQTQITIIVTSSEDNFPIAGANVLIKGKTQEHLQILMEILPSTQTKAKLLKLVMLDLLRNQ